jgi:Tol biopolymer transport system component
MKSRLERFPVQQISRWAIGAVALVLVASVEVRRLEAQPAESQPQETQPAEAQPAQPAEPSVPGVSMESRYLSNIRQVTSGMVKAGEGYFSPDGARIVYQAQPQGYPFYQIYTQPLEGGAPVRLSTGRGRTTCSYFSPDGTRIIFASSHLDPQLEETEVAARRQDEEDRQSGVRRRYSWDFDPQMDIFEADLAGNILRRLTSEPGYDAECAFSPDGRQIVFCSDRDGDPDLYIMNSDGGDVRQLTNEPGYDGGPFFSPDGRWVIYRTDRKREEYLQIHVIAVDGTGDVALTDNVGVHWAPYWHPREPYVIWTGADHSDPEARPNYDLWLARYAVDEGKFSIGPTTRITDLAAADVLPVFSPDASRLMWTSTRTEDGSSQLWIADFKAPQ